MPRQLILVVDDEDNLRDVLVEVLRRDGHEVDSAVDGAEGLRRVEERRYDLVIFMSANTGIDEYASFLAETGEPALEKPFNLADMRQVVMQVLSQVRSRAGGG
jgi:CheY-like chemotaxis protein